MQAHAELPAHAVIQRALSRTTATLARELHAPSAAAPDWSEFEWRIATAAASLHGISMLLARRLSWRGPESWQSFIAAQAQHSLARDARIAALLVRIDAALRAAPAPAVGLKGTALRALGLYAAGERPMADVDLLVHDRHFGAVDTALRSIDYTVAFTSQRHAVYEPCQTGPIVAFGEHPANPLKIEVHRAICERLPFDWVDITARLLPEAVQPGLAAYPDSAMLMLHLLLHAASNTRQHALRLVQLCDIARLAPRLSPADWQGILAWWSYPILALTARCFPDRLPRDILDGAARLCPASLRRAADRWELTEVSWSNLRIHALPGIWWARTPAEALRFAMSRAWPSRQALSELDVALDAQPQMRELPWFRLSQPRRIVRWLVSRPPRVQTILSVRAALAASGGQDPQRRMSRS